MLPLCGAALTFFAAAKKVSKESGLTPLAYKWSPLLGDGGGTPYIRALAHSALVTRQSCFPTRTRARRKGSLWCLFRSSLFAFRFSLFAFRFSLFAFRFSLFALRSSLFALRSIEGSALAHCVGCFGSGPKRFWPRVPSKQANTRLATGQRAHQPLRLESCMRRTSAARPGRNTSKG